MGRDEHLKHLVRAVAAAAPQAQIGFGPWRASRGARENIDRELRVCLQCQLRKVETVEHCLCVCPLYRTDMSQKLISKLSPGLLIDRDHPTYNPQLWTQVLLTVSSSCHAGRRVLHVFQCAE